MMLVEKLLLLQHGVVGVEGRPLLIVSNMTDESPRPLLQMLWRISLYVYEYDVDCIAIASLPLELQRNAPSCTTTAKPILSLLPTIIALFVALFVNVWKAGYSAIIIAVHSIQSSVFLLTSQQKKNSQQ